MSERKLYDETCHIPRKRGNGILRREVWVDAKGNVTRYNLAYINHTIFPGDNGRVLGYDNAHDYHHRHFQGVTEPYAFSSFQEVEARFEQEWFELLKGKKK